jgi:pilus assembly protein CpaD
MTTDRHHRRLALPILVLAAIAPALGGCFTDREATGSIYPSDTRDRHPITLANTPQVLDIFVQGQGGIDPRQAADLRTFLAEYRRYGQGPLVAQVPSGGHSGAARNAVATIRASAGPVDVRSYEPIDPSVASPIRLSFVRLQAKVADKCGMWPQDLGVTDAKFEWSNQPYWNFGCATQSNVASQTADPVDLVRGRTEVAPDTIRRMGNIDKLRQATDPSTNYRQDGQNKISNTVGN